LLELLSRTKKQQTKNGEMASGLLYIKKKYNILDKKDVCLQKLGWVTIEIIFLCVLGFGFFSSSGAFGT